MTSTSQPDRMAPDHSEFPALDGIRAVAVTAVVATHAAYWTGRTERGFGAALLARLDIGVTLFFVLSGFLLVRPWLLAAATGRPPPALRVYFWRRGLRILPAYWVAVALALLLLPANRSASAADWLRHLTLSQIYHSGWLRPGLTQTWSLCTEASFYVALPALGGLAVWRSRRSGWRPIQLLVGCAGLVGVSVLWQAAAHRNTWLADNGAIYWLPGFLGWFAAGMMMAVIHVDVSRRPHQPSPWRLPDLIGANPGSCWAIAAGLFLVAGTPVVGPRNLDPSDAGQAMTKSLLYLVVAVLIMWPCVFGRSRLPHRLLATPMMRWLGQVSYGVFLLHLIVLEGVTRLLGYHVFSGSVLTLFGLTLLGSIAAAALSFRLIEGPAMRLRRLVVAGARSKGGPPVAEPTARQR